ncbi:MAG: hypothetical protein MJA82_12775 [Clostridia bacterium]|nr:hypothetical protein [Clostridia bacterium]
MLRIKEIKKHIKKFHNDEDGLGWVGTLVLAVVGLILVIFIFDQFTPAIEDNVERGIDEIEKVTNY